MVDAATIPPKENEMYPNMADTENEVNLPTSPKNEIKSTVISSTVDNNCENEDKPIAPPELKIKGSLNNEDVDMRLTEDTESGNLETDLTKTLTDYGYIINTITILF